MYAIIDIETTSGKLNEESITEIAIYQFDGKQITDQFIALINPEKPIPDFVVKLTGITQKMLRNAPKFYQVAKRIIEITENCVLVAHNAHFDYRVLRNEFSRLGYDYQRKTLCSIALSRIILPGLPSYGLRNLSHSLGIALRRHHRAFSDALSTLEIFKILLSKDLGKTIISQSLPNMSSFELPEKYLRFLENLPESAGIFRLHNEEGKIIHIQKNNNIRYAALKLFISSEEDKKNLQKQTCHISFDEIQNKLICNIIFYQEIQKNKISLSDLPQKPTVSVSLKKDPERFYSLNIESYHSKQKTIACFSNENQAQFFIDKVENTLFQKYYRTNKKGLQYRKNIKKVLLEFGISNKTFVVVFKENQEKKYFLFFEKGKFKGYGFVTLNFQLSDLQTIKNLLHPVKNTIIHKSLIHWHLTRKNNYKIIAFQ